MLKELITRVKAETPVFFKRLRNMALSAGTSLTAAWAVISQFNVVVPAGVTHAISYAIVACAFIAGTSQLTKTDASNG